METFIPRQEIRRRLLARCGFTANDAQSPLVTEQLNEFIRAAALAVYEKSTWAKASRETRVTVEIDQRFVNYPANTTAGNILAIAVWDADEERYCPLQRLPIPLALDDEPLVDEGEPASVPGRARPSRYQLKAQIEIWQRPDKVYELKIDHTVSPDLSADAVDSVVDGELIILLAQADFLAHQGDNERASAIRVRFEERLAALRGKNSDLEPIRRGRYDAERLRRGAGKGYVPNSGAWPSVMPES